MQNNKKIVKELKDSIMYRSKHKKIIRNFEQAIISYFLDKYDFHVRIMTGVTWFAVEMDFEYYYGADTFTKPDFKIDTKVLYEFCEEFECEFIKTVCDGSRYIFTFNDVDMSNAFIMG